MAKGIPDQLQEQLEEFQQLQNQLAMTQQQRMQIESIVKETERALDELAGAAADAPVYRTVGGILFRTKGKEDAVAQLSDEKEAMEVRLSGFQKQEGRLKEKTQELQSKLQSAIQNLQGQEGG